ncbi:ThiF family adenylyltransferase [Aestuariibius sp. HNIBRBA575]|uniref:HesA/MoeB/ThiF family protein n=1 Tax=Aestuariibius sp. HNIBRBA575 TaxID=3233343 RepID=UPI0034A56CFE
MIVVLSMAAAMWGIGIVMKIPMHIRTTMIAVLFGAVILLHLILPDGHPLRQATGESAALWVMLLAFGTIIWGYAKLVRRLKARAMRTTPDMGPKPTFSETELDRYARHIVLRELGGPGQKALKNARVLVVGAGGLGSPALLYLAAAGVGTIGVIDDDVVDNSNLQRQVIHTDAQIATPKVFSAQAAMLAQNPHIDVKPYHRRLNDESAEDLFAEYDLILEGSDNFETRYLVNRVAAKLGKPVIGAALTQWEGQISTYNPANGGPCYECIFPTAPDPSLAPNCSIAGVIGPLPGVVGSLMAVEAVKQITGAGQGLAGRMLIYDALYAETRIMTLKPRADCPICGH